MPWSLYLGPPWATEIWGGRGEWGGRDPTPNVRGDLREHARDPREHVPTARHHGIPAEQGHSVAIPARISSQLNLLISQRHTREPRITHSANLCSPGHDDGVGDRGGQADEWGNVDWSAGALWFNTIFGWWQIAWKAAWFPIYFHT